MSKKLIIALLSLIVVSCVAKTRSQVDSKYFFDYAISNQRKNGIIQVFDDGHTTYVQFLPGAVVSNSVLAESDEYEKFEFLCENFRFCTSNRVLDNFVINLNGKKSEVTRLSLPTAKLPAIKELQ